MRMGVSGKSGCSTKRSIMDHNGCRGIMSLAGACAQDRFFFVIMSMLVIKFLY